MKKKNKTETYRYGCGCIYQRTGSGRTNVVHCGNAYCWGKAGKAKKNKHEASKAPIRVQGSTRVA